MRLVVILFFSAVCAIADPLTVSTSGTFDSSTPSSSLTEPGAAWSLSFAVDSAPATSTVSAGNGFDVAYSDFEYSVNGSAVTLPVADIRFFAAGAPGGLFSVCFETDCPGNAPPDTAVVFEGAQAYSGPEATPTIDSGMYVPTLEGIRDGTLRQMLGDSTITIAPSATPEPTTFAFFGLGMPAGAAGLRVRRSSKGGSSRC